MARNKKLYINDAQTALQAALNILDLDPGTKYTVAEIKAAATQAQQAAAALYQLAGAMDVLDPETLRGAVFQAVLKGDQKADPSIMEAADRLTNISPTEWK
jgi:hypothetical protein